MLQNMDWRRTVFVAGFFFLGCDATQPTHVAAFVEDPARVDAQNTLSITMVDVGQGDGLWLRTPSGTVIVLDGGPDRTGPFADNLKQGQVTRVDYVILSHAHSDHYTGLGAAIAMLPKDCTARVFDPGFSRPDISGYTYIRDVAGCRYARLGQNQTLALDPAVELSVLGVSDTPYPQNDGPGINNTSAIIRLRFGAFGMLFMGDAQTDAEKKLHAAFGTQLQANVLKVGHHGSCNATGTSLLSAVAPNYALISSGGPSDPNDFGHPHCQTISKLKSAGVHTLRTDQNGDVTLTTDGKVFAVVAKKGVADAVACPRNCANPTDF